MNKNNLKKYIRIIEILTLLVTIILVHFLVNVPDDPYTDIYWSKGIESLNITYEIVKIKLAFNFKVVVFVWAFGIVNILFYTIYRLLKIHNTYSAIMSTLCFSFIYLFQDNLLNGYYLDYSRLQQESSNAGKIILIIYILTFIYIIWQTVQILLNKIKSKSYISDQK